MAAKAYNFTPGGRIGNVIRWRDPELGGRWRSQGWAGVVLLADDHPALELGLQEDGGLTPVEAAKPKPKRSRRGRKKATG